MKDIKKRGYTSLEAAHYIGISESTLRQMRLPTYEAGPNRMTPIPYCKIGDKIIYLKDDIDEWLENGKKK